MAKVAQRPAMTERSWHPFPQIKSRNQTCSTHTASDPGEKIGCWRDAYPDRLSICGRVLVSGPRLRKQVTWARSSNHRLKVSRAHPVGISITSISFATFPHPVTLADTMSPVDIVSSLTCTIGRYACSHFWVAVSISRMVRVALGNVIWWLVLPASGH